MNLRDILRNDFAEYIRSKLVGDKCEFCGSTKELNFHHIDRFHNSLMETLDELKLQELDTVHYDEMELKCIRNFMLAKQIKGEYKTLCRDCHMKLHGRERYSKEYKEHYYNPYGGYVIINTFEVKDIIPTMLFRFMKLCVNMNYDNIVCEYNSKGRIINKIKCNNETLMPMLKLNRTELYNTLVYLKDNKLIQTTDENYIKINKTIVTKGFCTYKSRYCIFTNNINSLYDSVENTNHKVFGNITKLLLNSEYNYINSKIKDIIFQLEQKNVTRAFEKMNNPKPLLVKVSKNKYMINPWFGYNSGFNNAFKSEIEKFNSLI